MSSTSKYSYFILLSNILDSYNFKTAKKYNRLCFIYTNQNNMIDVRTVRTQCSNIKKTAIYRKIDTKKCKLLQSFKTKNQTDRSNIYSQHLFYTQRIRLKNIYYK
ncbi:MAG: hypothetical protein D3910_17430 [Candidatus Electrothrix sp. ATG2]|nr:hypothetical protein [Candidatus Electrothrix sp. ATG2]